MKNFFHGAFCAFEGINCFYKDRALWKFTTAPWLMLLAVYTGMIWLLIHLSNILSNYLTSRMADYPEFLKSLLEGSLTVIAVVLASVIILTTLGTLFEIFGGIFFDKLLEEFEKKYYRTELSDIPLSRQFEFTLQAVHFGLNTTILFLLFFILSFFLPLAGQILLFIIMGIRMAYSLLFAPGFIRGQSVRETRCFFRNRGTEVLGFGIAVYLIQLLPLLLPLTLPGIIIGASILYNGTPPCSFQREERR